MTPVEVRRYPFPYRAALAVHNDTDGMNWAAFEEWHAFVNGTGSTRYGSGLNLEVADSFWVWSDTSAFALRHAPPWDDTGKSAPEAGRIAELVRAGWLDTLHSFGDWRPGYQLTRDDVARGLEILDRLAAIPRVCVNHGGGDLRQHNIGGPWWSYQGGDDPENPSYNLGPLLQRGVRFFWTDALFEKRRFGENLRGRSRPADRPHRWNRGSVLRSYGGVAEPREIMPGVDESRIEGVKRFVGNNLIVPAVGRDGSPFLVFKRFRGREGPNSATFAAQVSAANLDALEEAEGVAVVYQHFGVWRALGQPKGHVSYRESVSPVLDASAVWAFRDLAERQDAGRLFVTTTARLLNYLWVRDCLEYSVADGADTVISIKGVSCPVYGRRAATRDDLDGIAFLVGSETKRVIVRLDGDRQDVVVKRRPDPLHGDRDAVFFPWRRLEYPALSASVSIPSSPLTRSASMPPCQSRPMQPRALSSTQLETFVSLVERTASRQAKGNETEAAPAVSSRNHSGVLSSVLAAVGKLGNRALPRSTRRRG